MILSSATRCLLNYAQAKGTLPIGPRRLFFSCSGAYIQLRGTQPVPDEPKDKWNYNSDPFDSKISEEYKTFRLVDANTLEKEEKPPHRVKMLVRDFIEDSLYNPSYGYFPKQATIFNAQDTMLNFTQLRDSAEFQEEVAAKYAAYGLDTYNGPGRQLWHTPTELFKPWYGRAVGRCLVSEYLLKYFPYEDFVIYEIGAGNGTLAMDVLNLLKEGYPDVYERTRYNIIEISASLARVQKKKLRKIHPCVNIMHKSIFQWNATEPAPCFVVAMEVIDNFAHDIVRYDLRTLTPYQGLVTIDTNGDFDIVYAPATDPLITSFLEVRRMLSHTPPINKLLLQSKKLRELYTKMPLAPNLSAAEYVPTRLLSLLRTLRNYFPRHRLLLSDFASLPDTIEGVNAPVVQTRFQNVTVPCTSLLVKQGYFDIFFPTNFDHLRDMYELILDQPPLPSIPSDADSSQGRVIPLMSTASSFAIGSQFFSSSQASARRRPVDGVTSASGLPVGERKSSVFSHSQFLETYAELRQTRLQNGENPILDFYKNVKFLF